MAEMTFDGRVAVVTGAGRGMGREHALLLAARGARVVVNDVGGTSRGEGRSAEPADEVVGVIRAKGRTAVANHDDISTPDGAQNLIAQALGELGGLDILVTNAGIGTNMRFADVPRDLADRLTTVNLMGALEPLRAAWPHFLARSYGRVVNITSTAALYGHSGSAYYAAGKGGVIGLTRVLSKEGEEHGIRVNAVAPAAFTRLVSEGMPEGPRAQENRARIERLRPDQVAPMVAWLAHESCHVNGQIFSVGGGRVALVAFAESAGFHDPGLSPESIRDNFDRICDLSRSTTPQSIPEAMDWLRANLGE